MSTTHVNQILEMAVRTASRHFQRNMATQNVLYQLDEDDIRGLMTSGVWCHPQPTSAVPLPQEPLYQTDSNHFIWTISNREIIFAELKRVNLFHATHHSGRAGVVDFAPRRLLSSRVEFCPSDLARWGWKPRPPPCDSWHTPPSFCMTG